MHRLRWKRKRKGRSSRCDSNNLAIYSPLAGSAIFDDLLLNLSQSHLQVVDSSMRQKGRANRQSGQRTPSDVPVSTGTSEIFILGGGPQGNDAFLSSHLELEFVRDESRNALHQSLTRSLAANVDIAIVRVSNETVPPALQLPVEFVEYEIA